VTVTDEHFPLCDLAGAAHVCWIVDDHASYVDQARALLARDRGAGRKPVAFGPQGTAREELGSVATVSLDPHLAILDGGPLQPEKMLAAFREQTAVARSEGFGGLCVVADMDWLLPINPTTDDIVTFEALLDQVVAELDATVVCAYRRSSFDPATIAGTLSVHPHDVGSDEAPQFRLVAGEGGAWNLCGEIDRAVTSHFAAALAAVLFQPGCVIDVTNLAFIDVLGMGTIAEATCSSKADVQLRGASRTWQRNWHLAGFDDLAPTVQLLA
jgi:anti-anti-sigma regulatory factor